MPLTSPMAHRRSPARRCSSTGMPRWGSAVDADRLQADPGDARAPAGCHQQPVAPEHPYRHPEPGHSRHRPAAPRWHASRASARSRPGAGPRRAPGPAARPRVAVPARHPRRSPPRRPGAAQPAQAQRRPRRHPGRAGGAAQPSCSSPRGYPRHPQGHAIRVPAARSVLRPSPRQRAPRCGGRRRLPPRRCQPACPCPAAGRCRWPASQRCCPASEFAVGDREVTASATSIFTSTSALAGHLASALEDALARTQAVSSTGCAGPLGALASDRLALHDRQRAGRPPPRPRHSARPASRHRAR